MKYISGLMLFVYLLFSCSSNKKMEQNEIIGKYVSQRTNIIKATLDYHLSGKIYSSTTIDINQDSSFVYNSCANIIKGNWKVSNDSLLLFVKSNRFRIDSLNYSKKYQKTNTLHSKEPMVWFIKGNKLRENLVKVKNNKKVYCILEKQ
jgi:hypothetical protein